ncbi:alcohol dehydrogenase [Terrimicrobium sacchariphilum]|uniref:Alcohol dehydrogenase n=1 Tax=Terrimicrobium sacchariphilum TaxID=690879 RepID=A0A146G6Z5_TERSA|nr:zinc-dependent alcohol dehydrogenase [Terrimicrobium sacchariphilum]GAT33340.1 alcohol dehydrogenase [Terrimicrobium sacchariphilum]
MRAVVYHSPKDMRVDTVGDPIIEDSRDIILRVTSTAICGSDLHIYNGFIPQTKPLVMGHEFMGVVEETGAAISTLKKGDRVVVPFPVACGGCFFCSHGLPIHCEESNHNTYGPEGGLLSQKGGALFGYTDLYGGYSGGQAEFVRVPYADFGPRKVSDRFSDDQVLFLTDIFPTGFSGVEWAGVQGGETVAVFGCGPVGLMAQKCAYVRGARQVIAIDIQPYRLEAARRTTGATVVNSKEVDPVDAIRSLTEGRGADVCIDAVGMEADRTLWDKVKNIAHLEAGSTSALRQCFSAVRRGGSVSILGVYGMAYDNFPLGQIFDKGITVHSGQAPVHRYIDELIQWLDEDRIRLDDIISHRLPLNEAPRAYEIFNEKKDDCVKVVLQP